MKVWRGAGRRRACAPRWRALWQACGSACGRSWQASGRYPIRTRQGQSPRTDKDPPGYLIVRGAGAPSAGAPRGKTVFGCGRNAWSRYRSAAGQLRAVNAGSGRRCGGCWCWCWCCDWCCCWCWCWWCCWIETSLVSRVEARQVRGRSSRVESGRVEQSVSQSGGPAFTYNS